MHERIHINFIEPGQNPQLSPEPEKAPNNKRLIFLILAGLLLVIIGGCLTKTIIGKYAPADPNAYDPITLKPKSPPGIFDKLKYYVFSQNNQLAGADKDRINILLLGVGGAGHDGPQLTDTIMLTSIKPSTGQIAMVSIPRDLAVDIPGYGIRKINNVNAYAESKNPSSGPEATKKIVEQTFNINIQYYVRVDFKAFAEIINEIGGVNVEVENSFTDQMYPTDNYDYQTVSFTKGVQEMDGSEALKFARSRHGNNGEGSDFARSKRQQKIILAVKEKIFSFGTLANPFRIYKIITSLSSHINTNFGFGDIMELARLSRNLDTKNIINQVFDDSPKGYLVSTYGTDGAYLLVPKDGNFNNINDLIQNIFIKAKATANNTPEQKAVLYNEAKVEIINGTWKAGFAARMKSRLEEKNFLVSTINNAEIRPQPLSQIYEVGDRNYSDTTLALQQELHIPIKQSLPEGIGFASSTNIVVLLGEDIGE